MKRPLLMVALVYLAGIIGADNLALPLPSLFISAGLALALCGAGPTARKYFLWLLIFLIGLTNESLHKQILSPRDLRALLGERTANVILVGTLVETPYQKFYEHKAELAWRSLAEVSVQSLREQGQEAMPAFGHIAVTTPGILASNFFQGQQVELTGVLAVPAGPAAEGLFDYKRYLERAGIYYTLQVRSTNDWKLQGQATQPPVADRFFTWSKRVLARGLPEEDGALQLLWAMTLGWKTALSGEVSEPFMRSGTMHIFAISGLHIALIAGIFVALLRGFQVPRAYCGLVVIPAIWFYTGVTGWQASAIRSTIMSTILIAGWSINRPSDMINSLAGAALIILLWDPQQLFQASFQLSFGVVLSLGLLLPIIEKWRVALMQPDPLLPLELRPGWKRWRDLVLTWVARAFATSFAAWLGSMPLIAYYFHLFTPVSLGANLVVVPLSSLALMCNMASLLCGTWLPFFGELFNHSAWAFMTWMIYLSEKAAHLHRGSFHIQAPGAITFVFYYLALVAIMAGWFRLPRWRWPLAGALGLLACGWFVLNWPERSATRLTILPVRGGHAEFLDKPGRANDWLVDCGEQSAAQFITKPYLRAQGVNVLSHLALTHGDVHHVGGAELIAREFAVRHVVVGPARMRSPVYRQLLDKFSKQAGLQQIIRRGTPIGAWEVLHPDATDHFPQADDNTLVFYGKFHGASVLLLSDLGKPGQNALAQRYPELKADIVVSGLPAQSEPLADGFLDLLQPKLTIVADSLFPARERASRALR
ncbi:MAG TPA: ComEC/Rec2 family competence protein, partial [Verrucomicrobiae bacterium]